MVSAQASFTHTSSREGNRPLPSRGPRVG